MKVIDCFSFEPKSEIEKRVFAKEALRIDLQVSIYELMLKKSYSKSDLSTVLQIAPRKVDAIFEDEWNPTVQEITDIYWALGEIVELRVK